MKGQTAKISGKKRQGKNVKQIGERWSVFGYILLTLLLLSGDVQLNSGLTECSCGSVVEHCVSSAKIVGSIPRELT